MNRYIPNILSILRIVTCPLLFLINDNNIMFIAVVCFIGLTDILDGFLARKYNCQTKFGAQLDSIGDLVFFVSLLLYMCVYESSIIFHHKELLIFTVIIKCIPLIISFIKHKKMFFIHTVLNKLSGIILVLGLILIVLLKVDFLLQFILLVIIVAGVEESIIEFIVEYPDENTRSIFIIRKTIT